MPQLALVTDADTIQPVVFERRPRTQAYARTLRRAPGGTSWWVAGDGLPKPDQIPVSFNAYATPGQTLEEARAAAIATLEAAVWVSVPGGYRLLAGARLVTYTPILGGWRFTAVLYPADATVYLTTQAIFGRGNGTGLADAFVFTDGGTAAGFGAGTGAATIDANVAGTATGAGTGSGTATGLPVTIATAAGVGSGAGSITAAPVTIFSSPVSGAGSGIGLVQADEGIIASGPVAGSGEGSGTITARTDVQAGSVAGAGAGTGAQASGLPIALSGPLSGSGEGAGAVNANNIEVTTLATATGAGTGTGTATGDVIVQVARVGSAIVGTSKAG